MQDMCFGGGGRWDGACLVRYACYAMHNATGHDAHSQCIVPHLPDNVCPPFVRLTQHVKQKQINIIIQRLVVQKQLGQVAQVLAKDLFLFSIHLKHAHIVLAIYFVPGRMGDGALAQVPQHGIP